MATSGPSKKSNFDRFIYYFAGMAIGFVMLGVIVQARKAAAGQGGGLAAPPNALPRPQTGLDQPANPASKPDQGKTSDETPKPQTTP